MTTTPTLIWQWPKPAWKVVGLMFLLALGLGVWHGNTVYLTMLGNGDRMTWAHPFLWEITGNVAAFCAAYLPYVAIVNARRPEGRWGRFLSIHGLACALFALACPPIFLLLRHGLYAVLGLGSYHYGPLLWRLPMEWQKCAMGYATLAGGFAFYLHEQDAKRKALREAELTAKLQEARLQALSAQLDPHFLFNALNTISSVMYENLERTDHLLSSLGQMLRDGLEGEAFWALDRELAHLDAFLDFAVARFGDRLRLHREIHPPPGPRSKLGAIRVPRFCLQRLVENSLKHNLDRNGQSLSISIQVVLDGAGLRMEVRDDGAGFDPRVLGEVPGTAPGGEGPRQDKGQGKGQGVGLTNLRETLALGFGSMARLERGNGAAGGAWVSIHLPIEESHA